MRILIVGAGIAGMSLAHLMRQQGAAVTVVEQASGVRSGGYKVDIRGAALEVVARMGVLDEIRARRTEIRAGSVVDATWPPGREHGRRHVRRAAARRRRDPPR